MVNSLAYYKLPMLLRQTHTTVSKSLVDTILSLGKHPGTKNPEEFGFTAEGSHYRVVANFDQDTRGLAGFKMDADRIQKLTQVVQFLE